jgi:omega-amidase
MRIHLVQFDIAWEDPPANHKKVAGMVRRCGVRPGDLVVLPEMFDTGFSLNVERTADDTGRTLGFLRELARDLRVYVQGGRTVRGAAGAKAQNRAPVVGPDGRVLCEYAKVHPFSFGREPEQFEGGREVLTYRWEGAGAAERGSDGGVPGLVVCPAVCYDLRFPELFRVGLLKGAEAYALGANWPESRIEHWRSLVLARAIENQAFVFAVNRTGTDPNLVYNGRTMGVGPRGDVLGELLGEEAVLSIPVHPREVSAWREKFPAWRDARLIGALVPDARP